MRVGVSVVEEVEYEGWRRRDGGGEVVEEKGRNSENEAVGGLGDGRRWRRVVMRLLAQITLNTETSCKKPLTISLARQSLANQTRADSGSGAGYIITTDNDSTTLQETF